MERFNPDYVAGWVHKDICLRLEKFSQDVNDRKSPRLMLFMPPRHGKSTLLLLRFQNSIWARILNMSLLVVRTLIVGHEL